MAFCPFCPESPFCDDLLRHCSISHEMGGRGSGRVIGSLFSRNSPEISRNFRIFGRGVGKTDMEDKMLICGQSLQGYRVHIVHMSVRNPFKGTVLMKGGIGDFQVATVRFSDEISYSDEITEFWLFDSYTHALAGFHKIVDEEAFLYDSSY